jgi:phospholipid/cholesterol/gamma-HCH transport system substrate-binding protein
LGIDTESIMSRQKTDFWVGLFVLLGLLALVFLALQAGNMSSISLGSTYKLSANFDNVGGLKVRAPVKSAGVTVGRIAAIRFDDQTFQANVTINLDSAYKFPKDSSAAILTAGLLGEQYLGLTAGSDEKNFADGDKIRYTQSAVVLENLISQFLYGTAEKQGSAPAPAAAPAPASAQPKPSN